MDELSFARQLHLDAATARLENMANERLAGMTADERKAMERAVGVWIADTQDQINTLTRYAREVKVAREHHTEPPPHPIYQPEEYKKWEYARRWKPLADDLSSPIVDRRLLS